MVSLYDAMRNMEGMESGHGGMESGHEGMGLGHGGHNSGANSTDATGEGSASSSTATSGHNHGGGATAGATAGSAHMFMKPFLFTEGRGFFVLFNEAFIDSTGGFVGALFASFFFAIFATLGFEVGKVFERRAQESREAHGAKALPAIVVGAVFHGFRLLLHYIAMLIVMTMNVWIILAVVLGHAAGFVIATFAKSGDKAQGKVVEAEEPGI